MPDENEELKEHIELQSKTIEEQSAELEKIAAQNKSLLTDLEKLKSASAPAPKDAEAAELKKQLDKALSENNAFKAREEQAILTKEFPKIKDWTVVTGDTLEKKKEHAKKISEMIPDPAPKLDKNGKPIVEDKGDKFKNAPPTGAPNVEALNKEEFDKKKVEMHEKMQKGDVRGVIDSCFELQPTAASNLFKG